MRKNKRPAFFCLYRKLRFLDSWSFSLQSNCHQRLPYCVYFPPLWHSCDTGLTSRVQATLLFQDQPLAISVPTPQKNINYQLLCNVTEKHGSWWWGGCGGYTRAMGERRQLHLRPRLKPVDLAAGQCMRVWVPGTAYYQSWKQEMHTRENFGGKDSMGVPIPLE